MNFFFNVSLPVLTSNIRHHAIAELLPCIFIATNYFLYHLFADETHDRMRIIA